MSSHIIEEENNMLPLVAYSSIELSGVHDYLPHGIWICFNLGKVLRLFLRNIDDIEAFPFYLFNIVSNSDQVIKTVGSSVVLTSCLPATDILSTLAGVTSCAGSSITSSTAGVASLAWFVWKLDKNNKVCYCICCITTRVRRSCCKIHLNGVTTD